LQIPLNEGTGGERDSDFTDNFTVRLLFLGKKHPENYCYDYLCRREGLQTSVGPGI
jgi:hypothetical protein